jgi:hypothetical protein
VARLRYPFRRHGACEGKCGEWERYQYNTEIMASFSYKAMLLNPPLSALYSRVLTRQDRTPSILCRL